MDLLALVQSVLELVINMLVGTLGGFGTLLVTFVSYIGRLGSSIVAVFPILAIVVGMVPEPVWFVFNFVMFGSVIAAIVVRGWGA